MRILLINNYQQGNETATFEALQKSLAGHNVECRRYHPGLSFDEADKDLVILSGGGGEGSEINEKYNQDKLWYQDQINFILSTKKPIVGICMGFEVIARAYGAEVVQMKDYVEGFRRLKATKSGRALVGKDHLHQHENHIWRVPGVSARHFEVLAHSATGVEMIKHKQRKIIATQFHPEVLGGTISLDHLIARAV